MNNLPILDELNKFKEKDYTKFFMPGHLQLKYKEDFSEAQNEVFKIFKNFEREIFSFDVTEVNNFDNLANPNGIIKKSQDIVAEDFSVKNAYYLVNGSTVGILSMISCISSPNDKIIIQKNSHKSVHNACKINFLNTIYIESSNNDEFDIYNRIDLSILEETLSNNTDAKALVITSPDYYGQNQDITKIAEITHKYEMILIVDSAHSPHYNYSDKFDNNPIYYGADMAVISFHKTLPSINQTAVIVTNHTLSDEINKKLQEKINIFQTTSPSYILLANIEICNNIMKKYGNILYEDLCDNILKFKKKIYTLNSKYIAILENDDFTRIIISSSYIHYIYYNLKEKFKIIPEMINRKSIVFIANIFHTKKDFEILYEAIKEIDRKLDFEKYNSMNEYENYLKNAIYVEKYYKKCKILNYLEDNAGKNLEKTLYLYPPGLPIIVENEKITEEKIDIIKDILYNDEIDLIL